MVLVILTIAIYLSFFLALKIIIWFVIFIRRVTFSFFNPFPFHNLNIPKTLTLFKLITIFKLIIFILFISFFLITIIFIFSFYLLSPLLTNHIIFKSFLMMMTTIQSIIKNFHALIVKLLIKIYYLNLQITFLNIHFY